LAEAEAILAQIDAEQSKDAAKFYAAAATLLPDDDRHRD
jgi:hypothetical protein